MKIIGYVFFLILEFVIGWYCEKILINLVEMSIEMFELGIFNNL